MQFQKGSSNLEYFNIKTRLVVCFQSCIDEWAELAKSLQLKVSPSISLTEMLGSNEFQLKLQLAGLSQDVQSIENVILMENSLCWSFIIDAKG